MTIKVSHSVSDVFAALWRRAPWWRFSLLSAVLFALLSALFPPKAVLNKTVPPAVLSEASYTPPLVRVPTLPTTVDTPLADNGNPPPKVIKHGTPPGDPTTPPQPIKPGIQTADLSLATPAHDIANKGRAGIDTAFMGRAYRDYITIDGFKLPLPQGEWAMLANSTIKIAKAPNNTGMSYFLGRIEQKQLVGAVIVYALRSEPSPGSGFGEFKDCNNPNNLHSMKEEIISFDHQSCWLIKAYFSPPWQQWADRAIKMSDISRSAAGDMSAKGVSYPQDLIAVQFFRSEKWGLLDVSYLFSPEVEGIKSNVVPTIWDSDWLPKHIQQHPEKIAYTAKLKEWGGSFWGRVKVAFEEGREPQ